LGDGSDLASCSMVLPPSPHPMLATRRSRSRSASAASASRLSSSSVRYWRWSRGGGDCGEGLRSWRSGVHFPPSRTRHGPQDSSQALACSRRPTALTGSTQRGARGASNSTSRHLPRGIPPNPRRECGAGRAETVELRLIPIACAKSPIGGPGLAFIAASNFASSASR
jgi:hypothetical protein